MSSFFFNTPEGKLEATRETASMYHYAGELVSRTHVFVKTGEGEEGRIRGTFVFDIKGDWWRSVMNHMLNNGFMVHANLPEIDEFDEAAFQEYVDKLATREASEIPDTLEGWDGA